MVYCNRIRDISYAGFLSVCRKLKSIVFTGNPATQLSNYRNNVKNMIPQLKCLDNEFFSTEDSESGAGAEENDLCRSEFEEEYFQEEQSELCDNAFETDDYSSSSKDNGEKKHFPMKDNTKKWDSDFGESLMDNCTSLPNRDCSNLLNLRKEKGENKQVKKPGQSRSVTVNIEETEDLVENNVIHSLYQPGSSNNGVTLPPLNTAEKELKKCSEKGTKNRSETHEKSLSLSSIPDFDKPSTCDNNALSLVSKRPLLTGAIQRTPKLERPYTGNSSPVAAGTSSNNTHSADTVKKRPYTAGSVPASHDRGPEPERNTPPQHRDLTSGLPICGNLAVALRNRRKGLEREEQENFEHKDM